MGELNSSIYTQRMVSHMFVNVKRCDGRPLIDNDLIIQTDDVLLYTTVGQDDVVSEEEMIEILDLFLHTVSGHNMAMHPAKCDPFVEETIYYDLFVT